MPMFKTWWKKILKKFAEIEHWTWRRTLRWVPRAYPWHETLEQHEPSLPGVPRGFTTREKGQSGRFWSELLAVLAFYLSSIQVPDIFFLPNTWPCLLATANFLQGTCNRLVFLLTTAPHNLHDWPPLGSLVISWLWWIRIPKGSCKGWQACRRCTSMSARDR